MKTYEVALKRASPVTVGIDSILLTVEALNEAHAEEKAYAKIDLRWAHINAEWHIKSIKEVVE